MRSIIHFYIIGEDKTIINYILTVKRHIHEFKKLYWMRHAADKLPGRCVTEYNE